MFNPLLNPVAHSLNSLGLSNNSPLAASIGLGETQAMQSFSFNKRLPWPRRTNPTPAPKSNSIETLLTFLLVSLLVKLINKLSNKSPQEASPAPTPPSNPNPAPVPAPTPSPTPSPEDPYNYSPAPPSDPSPAPVPAPTPSPSPEPEYEPNSVEHYIKALKAADSNNTEKISRREIENYLASSENPEFAKEIKLLQTHFDHIAPQDDHANSISIHDIRAISGDDNIITHFELHGIQDIEKEKEAILEWIDIYDLNEYGDPKDTAYTGGDPLFHSDFTDRFEYIIANHPDRPWNSPETPLQGLYNQIDDAIDHGLEELDSSPFTNEELQALAQQNEQQQARDTVEQVFNNGEKEIGEGNDEIRFGQFQNEHFGNIETRAFNEAGVFESDWDAQELETEFGEEYGSLGNKVNRFKNLETTLNDSDQTLISNPYHFSQAGKFLKKAQELEQLHNEVESNYGDYYDQEKLDRLDEAIDALRERAGLHYNIARTTSTPIIFDIDGNGRIDLTSVNEGVQFDIDGDGTKEQVAWTQAGNDTDGFLALDRNNNGTIDDGTELFGNQHGKANGFEELRQFDTNNDGIINASDTVYNDLVVWRDINHDGISQAEEMVHLQEAGVESIELTYTESNDRDTLGNGLYQQASFTRTLEAAQNLAKNLGISLEEALQGLSVDVWLHVDA